WTAEAEATGLRSGDVAVFSIEGDVDEEIIALVECGKRDRAERDALVTEIANLYRARHGVEARIILVPRHSLPQTSSGKLSRSRARAMYLAGAFALADAISE
ncbi:MAG TPA: hypothetical protein VID67_02945, partial [Rhizomicrobium sp.]